MNIGWVYAIYGPDGFELDTLGKSRDDAWKRFCYPALKRSMYDAKGSGFKCKRLSFKAARELKAKEIHA